MRNGDTVIHPASLEPRWFAWVDDMHDWCISRQLWWGHRIPIWYGPNGEQICVGPDDTPPDGWEQDPDVLDTWFSSALWPFSTLGWPEKTPDLEKFYPTSVLVTGYDILFFWVARMMMFGTFVGDDDAITLDGRRGPQVPFTDVFLHGLIRDESGRKMSKSRGNVIDPLEWVEKFGADACGSRCPRGQPAVTCLSARITSGRHGISAPSCSTPPDSRCSMARAGACTSEGRADRRRPVDPGKAGTGSCQGRFGVRRLRVQPGVRGALPLRVGRILRLVCRIGQDPACRWLTHTTAVLAAALDTLLRLLHPVIPFITEALWQALTHQESLVIAEWPKPSGMVLDKVAAQRITDMQRLVTEVRRFRSDQGLADRQKVPARLTVSGLRSGPSRGGGDVAGVAHRARSGFRPSASLEVRLGPNRTDRRRT